MSDVITIQSAQYANQENTSVVAMTAERGAVLMSLIDRPVLWMQLQAWVSGGGVIAPFVEYDDIALAIADAKNITQRLDSLSRVVRALAIVAMNSDNILRKRDRDFNAAVAAAGTLAALKTSVAVFPPLDDFVKNDIITALLNQLDNNA